VITVVLFLTIHAAKPLSAFLALDRQIIVDLGPADFAINFCHFVASPIDTLEILAADPACMSYISIGIRFLVLVGLRETIHVSLHREQFDLDARDRRKFFTDRRDCGNALSCGGQQCAPATRLARAHSNVGDRFHKATSRHVAPGPGAIAAKLVTLPPRYLWHHVGYCAVAIWHSAWQKIIAFGSVENPAGDWLIFAQSAEPRRAGVPVPLSQARFSTELP
jgi:hypothetical protein